MTTSQRLDLSPKTPDTAQAPAGEMLQRAEAQMGFVPNMYARMANSPGLLSTYLHGYQEFRENSGLSPVEQEVVFLTISRENGCDYCMAAHSVIADKMSKVPTEVTDAIRQGEAIPDAKLAALSEFTRELVQGRGEPDQDSINRFLAAGYEQAHVLELILAIAVKTLSNYANHLFATPVDQAFEARRWSR